jgi:predicted CopG family antitoxin
MVKTLKISDEAHRELGKVVGELQALNGRRRSFDDAIMFLIEEWRRKKGRGEHGLEKA